MKTSKQILVRAMALSIGIALVAPVSASAAPNSDNNTASQQEQAIAQQAQESGGTGSGGTSGPIDESTNCNQWGNTGQVPFLSGTVTDASGNPVAGAMVSAKILALSGAFADVGPFDIFSTKADGTYSICTYDPSMQQTLLTNGITGAAIIAMATPPSSGSGSTLASRIQLVSYMPPPGPSSAIDGNTNSCLNPATSATTACTVNFGLKEGAITGKVKNQAGDAIPNALVSIEYKYGSNPLTAYWTQFAQFMANSTGDFGISGFRTNNTKLRVRVSAPWCDPAVEPSCPYDNYGSITDSLTSASPQTDPPTPPTELNTTAKWDSNTASARDFQLVPANFSGDVKNGIGAIANETLAIVATSGANVINDSTRFDGTFRMTLPDGTWSVQVSPSPWSIGTAATYDVVVASGAVTSVSGVCSAETTPCGAKISLGLTPPNFIAVVKDTNGTVVPGGNVSVREYCGVSQTPGQTPGQTSGGSSNTCYMWSNGTYAQTGDPVTNPWDTTPAGLFGAQLKADTVYMLQMYPPYSGDVEVTQTNLFIKTITDGSGIKIQRCANMANMYDQMATPCAAGYSNADLADASNTLAKVDGRYTVTMDLANLRGVLCAPSGCDTTVGNTWVELKKFQANTCMNCTGGWFNYVGGSSVNSSGNFSMSITSEGRYTMEVSPPYSGNGGTDTTALYARTTLEFEAKLVGGVMKFYKVSGNVVTENELDVVPVTGKGDRVVLKYKSPSFVGVVQAPDGTKNSYSWVEVSKPSTNVNCIGCRDYMPGANTDDQGVFALALDAGQYYLSANPSWELQSLNLTKSEIKVNLLDCNSDGTLEVYTFSSVCGSDPVEATKSDGKVLLELQGANFRGTLKRPDTDAALPYANLNVEKWTACEYCGGGQTGYWQWANKYAQTNSTGGFGLTFSEAGKFRVSFEAPWNLRSEFSTARMVVNVTGTEGSFVITPEVDANVWSDNGSGGYNVTLLLPNASGTVYLADGTTKAANVWINVEKWSTTWCTEGCYQWSSEANGANTNADGKYAITLPAGQWRLTFNPPYGDTTVAKKTVEVVVTAGGTLCLLAASGGSGTTCPGATVAPGALNVQFPSPNFSGIVKNPDATVSQWSSIQFSTWSAYGYWQWTNVWANTDVNGKFGVNLTDNGVYRVSFEPSWSTSGVTALVKYLRVCDGGNVVELLANEAAAKADGAATCAGSGKLDNPATIYELVGSNIRGVVKDATDNSNLGDAWISVMSCGYGRTNNWEDWCQWARGTNTKSFPVADKGKFDLNLTNLNAADKVTQYVVEVNPPWNSASGLVRGRYTLWVRDFNTDGNDEWCLDSDYVDADKTDLTPGSCNDPRSGGGASTWTISLTAGNLAGKVLAPTGTSGVGNAWMQVEKWSEMPWNPGNYQWTWSNLWANANQNGAFGLSIEEAGLYRITASPGWDNSNGYARARRYVRVQAGTLDWCLRSGKKADNSAYPQNQSAPDDDACSYSRDNDGADGVTGFGLRLSSSNLQGILYTSSTDLADAAAVANASNKVRDAWITLQRKRTETWGTYSYEWWEWLGGTNTSGSASSKGVFGMNLEENGAYRLDVQPSWMSTGEDAQFFLEFTVTDCETTCAITVAPSSNVVANGDGTYAVRYPAPNFRGTVFGKDGTTKIAGSWISVLDNTTGQWVGGVSTGWNGTNAGKFSMRLADGTYRMEVWPRWDDANNGMRRTITVTVAAGAVTACSTGCALNGSVYDVTLLGETLSGKVYYAGASEGTDAYQTATPGNQTVMPWAWADAYSCTDTDGTQCDNDWNNWRDSQGSNYQGTLKFGLAGQTNPYLVRVYPNWSYFAGSPLRLLVKIDPVDSSVTWKYEGDGGGYSTAAFTPDFGHVPPNLVVTVGGATSARFVDLYRCVGGSYNAVTGDCDGGAWTLVVTVRSADDGAGSWKASFNVSTAGDYRVIVLRKTGDTGDLAGATTHVTHDGSTPVTDRTVTVAA